MKEYSISINTLELINVIVEILVNGNKQKVGDDNEK